MDALIAHYGGRIANTAGDSVLAEFESSVEAVRCAVEVQEALKSKNDDLPKDRRLLFRIGVNVGDVIQQGDDLLGDGINVAARLESIAEPGGVCISGEVRDQIDGKLTLHCISMGRQHLKNIRRPVRAFKVAGEREGKDAIVSFIPYWLSVHRQTIAISGALVFLVVGVAWVAWERWGTASEADILAGLGTNQWQLDQVAIDATAKRSIKAREIVKRGTFGSHEYVLVGTWGIKWVEAEAEARAMGGYLATVSSPEENQFIVDLIRDDDSVWRQEGDGTRWQKFGPWIGLVQQQNASEPDGGWVWSNGDPLTYTDWFWHQPDNYDGIEDFGRYRQFSDQPGIKWDDARANATAKGYVVEFESVPN